MIKSNPNIKGLKIFNHNYLYTAYADDPTFFLNDQKSIRELMKTFKLFSKFSGLKPNILKCEVAGIGSLKGVKMAVCGIKCIDLTTETIKILGVHLKNLQNKMSFSYAISLILKISLKRGMKCRLVIILAINFISNRNKLSIQFLKLGKKY